MTTTKNNHGGKRPNAGRKKGQGLGTNLGNKNALNPLSLRSIAKLENPPISAEGLRKRLKRQNKTLAEYISENFKRSP